MTGFWEIDPYADDICDEAREIVLFLLKRDDEGGTWGLIKYGGAEYFPEPLRALATKFEDAGKALDLEIRDWAKEHGVTT